MSANVLVTGGAGYIGSHACKALARAGLNPVVFDNRSTGHRWAVRWGPFVHGDLADFDLLVSVLRKHGIRKVIHFAAHAYVGESMRAPGKYFQNNSSNSINLLNAMVTAGASEIIFSSTCATYGLPRQTPIDENHPQVPVNPYGESKLFVERVLKWYESAHGIRFTALRYFNAAGADPDLETGEDHDPETHLIPLTIAAATGGAGLEIFGDDYPTKDGTAVRDYVHVADLADAHVRALVRLDGGEPSDAFNLGTGQGHTVKQVIEAVERETGAAVKHKVAARRAGDPAVLVADASKAHTALDWRPDMSRIETIVATAYKWHLANQEQDRRQTV